MLWLSHHRCIDTTVEWRKYPDMATLDKSESIWIYLATLSVTANLKLKSIGNAVWLWFTFVRTIKSKINRYIQSDRHLLLVRDAKGNKDRTTILSEKTLLLLRKYHRQYEPKEYLFKVRPVAHIVAKAFRIFCSGALHKQRFQSRHLLTH